MEAFAAPESQGTWQVGQTIHNVYEVKEILGEGGMGRVYRVYDSATQKDLAVKRPLPAIFAEAGGKERFMLEAETWARLEDHPHIVPCHFVQMYAHIPCIFIEYIAGGSLADWIEKRTLYQLAEYMASGGRADWIEKCALYQGKPTRSVAYLLDLAIQMAQGLEYAHTQGLVHRDVKPTNVLLTPEGIAKITDFGLAQARFLAGEVTRSSRAGVSGVEPGVGMMTRNMPRQSKSKASP